MLQFWWPPTSRGSGRGSPAAERLLVAQPAVSARIALPTGTGIRTQLENVCAEEGLKPRVAFEASASLALAELAERGPGVAILPRAVARNRPGLSAIAIEPELRGRLVLVWRSSGPISPAVRVLVDMARAMLRVGADA